MKVKELIKRLQTLNPEVNVVFNDGFKNSPIRYAVQYNRNDEWDIDGTKRKIMWPMALKEDSIVVLK